MYSPEKPRDDGLRTHKTYGPLHEERNCFYITRHHAEVKRRFHFFTTLVILAILHPRRYPVAEQGSLWGRDAAMWEVL